MYGMAGDLLATFAPPHLLRCITQLYCLPRVQKALSFSSLPPSIWDHSPVGLAVLLIIFEARPKVIEQHCRACTQIQIIWCVVQPPDPFSPFPFSTPPTCKSSQNGPNGDDTFGQRTQATQA
jgi:hypothetical protein